MDIDNWFVAESVDDGGRLGMVQHSGEWFSVEQVRRFAEALLGLAELAQAATADEAQPKVTEMHIVVDDRDREHWDGEPWAATILGSEHEESGVGSSVPEALRSLASEIEASA